MLIPFRKVGFSLVAIMILAVLLRVLAAFYLGDHVEVLPGIYDQVSYDALGQSIVSGKGYQFGTEWYPFTPAKTPTSHWSFLYPLYLAGVYSAVGYHPLVARLLQAVMGGVLTCWLVYRLGRRIGGPIVGLVAALVAAVYAYFIYYNAALMTETLHIIAVLWALDLTVELTDRATTVDSASSRRRNAGWLWLGLGFALGIATLQRQATLLVVPVLLLWLAWVYRLSATMFFKGVVLAVGVVACMVLPWTVRNYWVFDSFSLLNTNAGFAFYWSNHPVYGQVFTRLTNDPGPAPPLPQEAEGLNEAQLDRLLMRKGIQFVLEDPSSYLVRSLQKAKVFFMFLPMTESSPLSNLTRVLSFGITLPFMLIGLWLSRSQLSVFMPIFLFVICYSLVHILSWPGPRYRLSIDAALIPFAALALVTIVRRLHLQRISVKGTAS